MYFITAMNSYDLDETDHQMLHRLQQNTRSRSTEEIGDAVSIASSIVRNRINNHDRSEITTGGV